MYWSGTHTGLFCEEKFADVVYLWCVLCTCANEFTQVASGRRKACWKDNRPERSEEVWWAAVSRRPFGLDPCTVHVGVCVCTCVWFCSFSSSSMSSCQNKRITFAGAKAGIQKFISSTICIDSLYSATMRVCVCVCIWHSLLQALKPTPTCFSVMVFLRSCVAELKCSPSLCWRFELQHDSCSKNSSLRSRVWQLLQQRHDRQGEKL